jgi:hypothetical protein
MTRRGVLRTGAGVVASAVLGPSALGASPATNAVPEAAGAGFPNFGRGEALRTGGALTEDGRFIERQRAIPSAGRSEVLVCGAGPAGIGAALSAARAGATVQLLERAGCLGGTWTAGLLTKIIDGGSKAGVMREILRAMAERGSAVAKQTGGAIYDPELMRLALEELCAASGVKIRLNTQLVGAVTDPRNRLVAVVTESKSGRQAWAADRFIDCSGDGDLAAQAGCTFEVGVNDKGECQPMSLLALLTGVEPAAISDFVRELAGEKAKPNLLKLMQSAGINPSFSQPTLRHLYSGIFSLMTNHEYGVPAYDADKITEATIRARREVHDIVGGLRKLGGPWKELAVVATAEQIGVREGRRIRGRYRVTAEDLTSGKRHADAVCRVSAGIDIHNLWPPGANAEEDALMAESRRRRRAGVKAYDIPLRALIAADVDGLMMAGRCISGDFIAHASYRVTGNAVQLGEAAGLASAESLKRGVLPHELTRPVSQERPS